METLGRYHLLKKIASGGMARIYVAMRADQQTVHTPIVVKRILPELAEDVEFIRMFLDEARIAARLAHPNIVAIDDVGAVGRDYFIAMEFIHGFDGRKVCKMAQARGMSMPVEVACRIVADAAAGLDYAHKKVDHDTGKHLGIVHRDVSPQNILIGSDGRVKVSDFGIAQAMGRQTTTRTGALKGKFIYMAPEQAAGGRLDARTDQFSLGLVLYEFCTSERPFRRSTSAETIRAVTACKIAPPSNYLRTLAPELEKVLMKALARDPAERWPDAAAFKQAIEDWIVRSGARATQAEVAAFVQKACKEELDELAKAASGALGDELHPWNMPTVQLGKPLVGAAGPTVAGRQRGVAERASSASLRAGEASQSQDTSSSPTDGRAKRLPRGGVHVLTSAGAVQFGIPPETIKDSMDLGLEVPTAYVVPTQMFHRERGINVAEFEFPVYYNYFLASRRTRLVVDDAAVEARVRAVFRESFHGPADAAHDGDFAEGFPRDARPDFAREAAYFRTGPGGARMDIDTLVEFCRFDQGGFFRLGDRVVVEHVAGGGYVVRDGGKEIARAPETVAAPPRRVASEHEGPPFEPPAFGFTVLGASHGFDPAGKTTGFVLWVGHRGLLVDPPVDATVRLSEGGISPALIDGIILTHCHADHDSGTFQKILEEGRTSLFSTHHILGSFLRKYSVISGLEEDFLRRTFTPVHVKVGTPTRVHGAELWFFYTLHSIPTVGFKAYYGGKSLAFSADSLYDPDRLRELRDKGVITDARYRDLLGFPWYHTAVLHEAGIPPLHTPVAVLAALPTEVKKRLYLVHIAEKDVPPNMGLRAARVGVEHTMRLEVDPPPHAAAMELLDVFSAVDIFNGLPISRAREILQMARRTRYDAGEQLIAEGAAGDRFYLVVSGTVVVNHDGRTLKELRAGDFFGETALVSGRARTADVVAKTAVELVEIDDHDFLYLIRGTDIQDRLIRLARMREERSWEVLEENSVLQNLSSAQKTQLLMRLELRTVHPGELLWRAGDDATEAVLVDDATVALETERGPLRPFGFGTFLGEVDKLYKEGALATTARVVQGGRVFRLSREDLSRFFDQNPGVLVSFLGTRFVE